MRENLLPEKKFRPGFTPMLVHTGRELIRRWVRAEGELGVPMGVVTTRRRRKVMARSPT
ncbi:MAG TPA: hypothetical protein VFZ26_10465 [Gemmatimonadales bacterium]